MSVFITYLSYNKYLKCTLTSSRCTIGLCGPGRADLISSGLPLPAALARGRKAPVFLNSGRRWANTEPLSGLASPVGPWRWAGRVPRLWVPVDGSQGVLPAGLWAGAPWSPLTLPCPGGAGRLQPRNEGRAEALVRGSCPRSRAHPSGWPRARPTCLPSALGRGSLDGGTPPFPGAAWAPGPGKPLWDLLTKLHRPLQVGTMSPIGEMRKLRLNMEKRLLGHLDFLGAPGLRAAPRGWPACHLSRSLPHVCSLIQERLSPSTVLLPPSLSSSFMHPQVWAAPDPGAPSWGSAPSVAAHTGSRGSLRAHNPCTWSTLRNPQTTSQNHIYFAHKHAPRSDGLVSALPGIPSAGITRQPPCRGQAPRLQPLPGPGPPPSLQEGARAGAGGRAAEAAALVPLELDTTRCPPAWQCSAGTGR